MHKLCQKKNIQVMARSYLTFVCLLLFLVPFLASAKIRKSSEKKIKTQTAPITLNKKIERQRANPRLREFFDSTLFKQTGQDIKYPATLRWLKDTQIQEKRRKILGSQSSTFETWWKIGLDGFLLADRLDYTEVIRSRINTKLITQFTESFFAQATFELLVSTGAIQQIWQKAGESEISQREILLLFKATDWLTIHLGAINQEFLQSPLLLADIPFPSIVQNISLFNNQKNQLDLTFQQAIPTTFSASNSFNIQELTQTPLFFTSSLFWQHNSKAFYKLALSSSFFHYRSLPESIAINSIFHGNTLIGESNIFAYDYTGFYIGFEPSVQLFSSLGVKMKLHYINNITKKARADNVNEGVLYSLEVPFDITEKIRITPRLEYFINQPDASVGYYNSERYGHSDRTGFLGEITLSLYERNMEIGFRHLRSKEVRSGSLKEGQTYYLVFLRTNYAKI